MAHGWISVDEVAHLADLSRQGVHKAVARARAGHLWQGAALVVKETRGRGGRGGVCYLVREDSLPDVLKARLTALRSPAEDKVGFTPKARTERAWWWTVLEPVLATPKHSPERGEAIRAVVATIYPGPDGKPRRVTRDQVYSRVARMEAEGHAGAGKRKRVDAGGKRVIVTRAWDAAAPFPDAVKERIGEELRQYIRGLIQAGEARKLVAMHAQRKLKELGIRAGWLPTTGDAAYSALCRIPDNMIQAERVYRKVYRFNHDRKAHEDAKPRVRRTRDGMAPMDVVFADIHPVDILVRRDDGSVATPRMIAWLDAATNRVRGDFVLFDKGEAVRNSDVIWSFERTCAEWGLPKTLYVDNGGEYNWTALVDDAMKLVDATGGRACQIVTAMPYNAPAKPIEGTFGNLERRFFRTIPGWIGGDRMRKKMASVGRPAEPWPGAPGELFRALSACIALYNATSQKRALKGRSPDTAFAAAVAAGWTKTTIEPETLRYVFSERKRLKVTQGIVRHRGKDWTCDELAAWQGDHVVAVVPRYREAAELVLVDDAGKPLGTAREVRPWHYLDPAGAREAARLDRHHKAGVRQLEKSVPKIDVAAERRSLLAALPPPVEAPVGAVVRLSDEHATVTDRMNETPAARAARKKTEKDEKLKVELEKAAKRQAYLRILEQNELKRQQNA